MAVKDINIQPSAQIAKERMTANLTTATGQTNLVAFSYTPGFRFQIVRVRSFCSGKAGTITARVLAGTRVVATVTFTAATENNAAVSATLANVRGSSTEAITVDYTSDGSGALTNGSVTFEVRPWPMANEAAVGP